jgi:hypothetical protein
MSHHHHHISTALALALALAAVAPSAASARPAEYAPATTTQAQAPPAIAANAAVGAIQAQGARVARELAARDARAGSITQSPPPVRTVTVSQPNGFAWGDAGIGAGAIFALTLVLLGSTLYLTQRRTAHAS